MLQKAHAEKGSGYWVFLIQRESRRRKPGFPGCFTLGRRRVGGAGHGCPGGADRVDAFPVGPVLNRFYGETAAGEPFDQFVRRRKALAETVIGFGIYYRGYKTKNGALTVGCLSPATRERMRTALDIEDPLEGSSAKSAPEEAIARIEAMFECRTTDEWMAIFDAHGVPASPVSFVEVLLDDP